MFGIGWTEMLLIGVVALIVIGPKDLPVVMNRLGKAVSAIRRMGSEFQREINKASGLDTITDLRKSITEPLKQTAADIRKEFNKPLPNGGVAPSGIIAPKDPKAESVVDEIHEKVGMSPSGPAPQPYTPFTKEAQEKYRAEQAAASSTEAPKPADPVQPVKPPRAKKAAKAVESPAPAEAIAPAAKKVRAPRKAVAAAAGPPDMFASEPHPVARKPAAPRKPRAAKPKPEA